jgi:hypothetical protein
MGVLAKRWRTMLEWRSAYIVTTAGSSPASSLRVQPDAYGQEGANVRR